MGVVLEVVEFIGAGTFVHVGYMNAKFQTRKDAASYYDRHNPHMRSLNAYDTWASDWDPVTRLKYIVREDCNVQQTIAPFDPADLPRIDSNTRVYSSLN